MTSLLSVIDCLGRQEEFEILRAEPGEIVKGRSVRLPRVKLNATGSIQELNGKERQELPEGLRSEQAIVVNTACEVRADEVLNGTNADNLCVRGRTYRVFSVADWSREGGFYRVIAVRIGQ